MKKIIPLLLLVLLTSCWMTQQEKLQKIKDCKELWLGNRYDGFYDEIQCSGYPDEDKVITCIQEYTNGIDEKYNNPDTVSNLREDNYSQVVKTCNEIFGKK